MSHDTQAAIDALRRGVWTSAGAGKRPYISPELSQEDCETILAALQSKPVYVWQDIRTAPRDGSGFLIDCEQAETGYTLAYYNDHILCSIFDGKPYLSHVTPPTLWMKPPPLGKENE